VYLPPKIGQDVPHISSATKDFTGYFKTLFTWAQFSGREEMIEDELIFKDEQAGSYSGL
jgi:hypothetical protein